VRPTSTGSTACSSSRSRPIGILLPILGILSVTSEWSQRTTLLTFALVPRRERVTAAKALAACLLGALGLVVCLAAAAVGNLIVDGSWANRCSRSSRPPSSG
jgi:hypothetical protein